jgi:hypothetical protein
VQCYDSHYSTPGNGKKRTLARDAYELEIDALRQSGATRDRPDEGCRPMEVLPEIE